MSLRLLLSLVAIAFCTVSADAQSVLKGHHLDNDKVGFYGFCVDIPMAYEPFTPDASPTRPEQRYAMAGWNATAAFDRKAGFTTKERIPFYAPNRGFIVLVATSANRFPPLKRESEYLRTLDVLMSWCISRSKNDIIRDIRKIDDIHVGRVALASKGHLQALNLVMIPPSTLLTFYIVGPESEKDDLLADLDAAVATLNIGKKGPH